MMQVQPYTAPDRLSSILYIGGFCALSLEGLFFRAVCENKLRFIDNEVLENAKKALAEANASKDPDKIQEAERKLIQEQNNSKNKRIISSVMSIFVGAIVIPATTGGALKYGWTSNSDGTWVGVAAGTIAGVIGGVFAYRVIKE